MDTPRPPNRVDPWYPGQLDWDAGRPGRVPPHHAENLVTAVWPAVPADADLLRIAGQLRAHARPYAEAGAAHRTVQPPGWDPGYDDIPRPLTPDERTAQRLWRTASRVEEIRAGLAVAERERSLPERTPAGTAGDDSNQLPPLSEIGAELSRLAKRYGDVRDAHPGRLDPRFGLNDGGMAGPEASDRIRQLGTLGATVAEVGPVEYSLQEHLAAQQAAQATADAAAAKREADVAQRIAERRQAAEAAELAAQDEAERRTAAEQLAAAHNEALAENDRRYDTARRAAERARQQQEALASLARHRRESEASPGYGSAEQTWAGQHPHSRGQGPQGWSGSPETPAQRLTRLRARLDHVDPSQRGQPPAPPRGYGPPSPGHDQLPPSSTAGAPLGNCTEPWKRPRGGRRT